MSLTSSISSSLLADPSQEASHRVLFDLFTISLPQQLNCSYGDWPKEDMICSDNAVDCINGECICATGWSGKVDFVGSNDCQQNLDFLHACLVFFMCGGYSCFLVVLLWNYRAIKVGIESYRKGKPILPKTLSYMWFVWEGAWQGSGTALRLITGNRFGYSFVANACMTGDIVFFIIALFYFIDSWVTISIAATSKGSKRESKAEAARIVRALQYQLTILSILITFCFIGMLFITDEVNVYREHLTRGINLCTSMAGFVASIGLYRAGKVLARAIKLAGADDMKLAKIGRNMLRTTNILTFIFVTITVSLFSISVIPFLMPYNMYVIAINFGCSFFAPIAISLLLETPPWRKLKIKVGVSSSSASGKSSTINGSRKKSSVVSSKSSSFASEAEAEVNA